MIFFPPVLNWSVQLVNTIALITQHRVLPAGLVRHFRFQAYFTCSLKGWELDVKNIKPEQFLRDLQWGLLRSALLSSRSALAQGFFHIYPSRACFDQCCRALLPQLSTGQPNERVTFVKIPFAQPSKTNKHSNPGHRILSASATTLNFFLTLCKNDAPTLPFSSETLLVFALPNSSRILKHFSPPPITLWRGQRNSILQSLICYQPLQVSIFSSPEPASSDLPFARVRNHREELGIFNLNKIKSSSSAVHNIFT